VSDKPTVVLLPGLDGTGRLYRWLVSALEPEARVQVISYPTDGFLGYRELAELVVGQAPAEDYAIVAESFSGPVAAMVGAKRPARLRGILLSASFVVPPAPGWLRVAPLNLCFRFGAPRWLLRYLLLDFDNSRELVAEVAAVVASVTPSVLGARVREVLRANAADHLRSCVAPVVYLAANSDRLVGSRGLRAAQRVRPSVEAVTINGPHMLFQAKPIESAAVISKYLRRWFAS
jgi:pimeloyl-ACP methyl ester carboxylesterase